MRQRACCKMRHGRERPCLKTPLRFESWLALVLKRSDGRISLSGRASRALCKQACASVHARCGAGVSAHAWKSLGSAQWLGGAGGQGRCGRRFNIFQ